MPADAPRSPTETILPDGQHTRSYWSTHESVPSFPPLRADAEADVCVVGGGIAGLSVAYALAEDGARVLVLEDGEIGSGETGRTTAHLSTAFDDGYAALERIVGVDGSRLVAEGHAWAIDRMERIAATEGVDCGFARVDGFLLLADGDERATLEAELEASHRAGIADAAWDTYGDTLAVRYPRQAQLRPLQYVAALAQGIVRRGGRVHTHTHASRIAGREVVTRDGHVVRCAATVVATLAPSRDATGDGRPDFSTWQPAYRTYVVAARLPRDSTPFALLWDTDDPYHYVRMTRDGEGDLLLVGGEDHKAGQGGDDPAAYDARYDRIEAWMRARFPQAGDVVSRWSGQLMEPVDYVASIGRHPGAADDEPLYVVTGDSGHGMTHATIAGRILTRLIAGRDDAWSALYDPSRLTYLPHDRRVLGQLVAENANVLAARMGLLAAAGRVGQHVADDATAIAPGSGALLRRVVGDETVVAAAYRDASGELHLRSARCPHRGCTVGWNPSESTWDCPCHGSRFDATGRVIDGPAGRDLDRLAPTRDEPDAVT